MAVFWNEPSDEVIEIANQLIDKYHPLLREAKIGFVFRSEAMRSNGKVVLGKAQKVSDKDKHFNELDFIIWIAFDRWADLAPIQRRALIDHELCHCRYDPTDLSAAMRPHDIEEFVEIFERYGLWKSDLINAKTALESAVQQPLGLEFEPAARGGAVKLDNVRVMHLVGEGA